MLALAQLDAVLDLSQAKNLLREIEIAGDLHCDGVLAFHPEGDHRLKPEGVLTPYLFQSRNHGLFA